MAPTAAVLQPRRAHDRATGGPVEQAREDLIQVLTEINGSGAVLEEQLLVRLARATRTALRAVREAGPCGYHCPRPGLHCPANGFLDDVVEALAATGYQPAPELAAGQPVTCVCGWTMEPVALRRGDDVRVWASCGWCWHWVDIAAGARR